MRPERLLISERKEVPKKRVKSTRARRRGRKPTFKSLGGQSGNKLSSKGNHAASGSGLENKIDVRELRQTRIHVGINRWKRMGKSSALQRI